MEEVKLNIKIDGQRLKHVTNFKYLGSIISEDGRNLVDIKTRIELAKQAFNNTKVLLTKQMKKPLRKRMIRTLVWPVALYGCETWTLRKVEVDKLEASEMWLWRQMEGISWRDKIGNEEVLKRVDENKCLMKTVYKRRKNWIGHVIRGDGLLRDVLEERMMGKRVCGRPRIGMLDELMEGSFVKMNRRAETREAWKEFVPRTCRKAEH